MNLCRVTGDVVSTVKNPKLHGHKLLLVQPVELDGRTPRGASFLALERVHAGVGDLVLVLQEGGGVRILYADDTIPAEAVVIAVVDDLEVHDWDGLAGASTLEHRLKERSGDAASA